MSNTAEFGQVDKKRVSDYKYHQIQDNGEYRLEVQSNHFISDANAVLYKTRNLEAIAFNNNIKKTQSVSK
jgi:hypothetical protein